MKDETKPDDRARENFGSWWFLNGGMLHGLWKRKQYSKINELARTLPREAYVAGYEAGHAEALVLAETVTEWLRKAGTTHTPPDNDSQEWIDGYECAMQDIQAWAAKGVAAYNAARGEK